jgi:hypothetical protein
MSFVGTKLLDRRGRDLHQEAIHQLLVATERRAQSRGDGHDGVKIVAGQEFGLTLLEPLLSLARMAFGTGPVATAVVAPKRVIAVVAAVESSPQLFGAAGGDVGKRLLVRGHHPLAV